MAYLANILAQFVPCMKKAVLVNLGCLIVSLLRETRREGRDQSDNCLIRAVRLDLDLLLFNTAGVVKLGEGPVDNVEFIIGRLIRGDLVVKLI
eukprot:6585910-Ditylum_brightwellii.AAC.1